MQVSQRQELRIILPQTIGSFSNVSAWEAEIDPPAEKAFLQIRASLDFDKLIKASPFQSPVQTLKSMSTTSSKSPLTRKYLMEPDSPVSPGLGLEEEETFQLNSQDTTMNLSSEVPRGILKSKFKSRFSTDFTGNCVIQSNLKEPAKAVTLQIENHNIFSRKPSSKRKQTCVMPRENTK